MTATLVRAALCSVLAALLGPALLALSYAVRPAIAVDFDRDLPRLFGGVYPVERDAASGLTFAWTGPELVLRLPALDRRVDWTLSMRARGARPDPSRLPELTFFADGMPLETHKITQDFSDLQVTIPARPNRNRDALITMRVSDTFTPGPNDPRPLGVVVDALRLEPRGLVLPPRRAFFGAAVSAAILGAAVALLGVTAAVAMLAALLISAVASTLLARGFAPFTGYPTLAIQLAAACAAALLIAAAIAHWRNGQPLRNTAKFAIAFSAFAAFLKLLVILHPDMPIGDALFHAHRFRLVDSGTYVFTTIAPGGYQFPYAPGLYVTALPLADWVTRNTGDMALLRILVVAFDAAAGALLYFVVVRAWGHRLAGAVAVALYHLMPIGFEVVRVGNLTNAFAQALAVFSLALVAAPGLRLERRGALAGLTLLLAAAFMSHTSTFAILVPACALIALLFVWKGGPALRSPAWAIAVALLVAGTLAVLLYYRHFGEVYRAEWTRISAETAGGTPDVGGRTAMDRLRDVPRLFSLYFGLPMLALAAIGAYSLFVRASRDRLTLGILGWAVACLAFLALGIATPVDMRYYLMSVPAVAIAAAAGASWMWARRGAARPVAIALLAWAAAGGALAIMRF